MEHKRAWIYCRVAYPDTHALAVQQTTLEDYAEQQGFELVGTTAGTAAGPWPGADRLLQQELFETWTSAHYSQSTLIQPSGKTSA